MYSLNRATIIGNLTRDPELRQIPSGTSVCTFGVATNRQWTDPDGGKQEAVEFHNIVVWRKMAEVCQQYLSKGKKVYVEGRLQTRDWDGQDGVRRYRTEIIAENIIFLSPSGGSTRGFDEATLPEETRSPKDEAGVNPDDEIKVEDVPF
jgi:single-strand DNA-binding protein